MKIELLWQGYKDMVVPGDASDVQIQETRQAFFAGAASLLTAVNECLLDPGDEPTQGDLERMSEIQAELDEFGQQLDRRYLGEKHEAEQ